MREEVSEDFPGLGSPRSYGIGAMRSAREQIGCFLLAGVLENQEVDDEEVHQNIGCSFAALSGTG